MPHTLLLADDSVTIQRVIELTFADRDVSVVAVGDGESAMRALAGTPPDIVLADIDMPGPSGYDIARHVSQTPSLRHVPVLLLSGAFDPIDEERARASGSEGVLTKPFEPEEVIRRVTELLASRRTVFAPAATLPVAETFPRAVPPVREVVAEPDVAAPTAPAASARLDDYFDQLDRAFAERMATAAAKPPEPSPATIDMPIDDQPAEPARPLLASAFSALLDAEQSDGDAAQIPEWMIGSAPANAVSDALVEQITRRVLERLTDRVVRETVTDLVSTTAERLVLQEIERIKSNIK